MPITHRIDSEAGLVRVTFVGRVTIEEFRASRIALTSDPQFRESLHRLTDVRELTDLPTMADLRELAMIVAEARRREPKSVRRSVVVGSRSASYGAIRQYQTFLALSGFSVDILRSEDEVGVWVANLPIDQVPPTDGDAVRPGTDPPK